MANVNFKALAKKAADNSSFIMEGRNKLTIDEIISRYPDGITVIGVDKLKGRHGDYAVGIFAEEDGFYFNGGSAFTQIVDEWAPGYTEDGSATDYEALSADLAEAGGVKMKFEKTKTQSGNNFTRIDIIE